MCNGGMIPSDQMRELLESYYRDTLGLRDWQQAVSARLRDGLKIVVSRLAEFVEFEGKRILDVGCGSGDMMLAAKNLNSLRSVIGVDPDMPSLRTARNRLDGPDTSVYCATAEHLPFADETFDIVLCHQVMEHVDNLEEALSEMVRVCVPGGWCYVSAPNYLLPYEPHYRLPLIPWLPKWLAVWWLKTTRRDPTYLLQSIRYVNAFALNRKLRKLGMDVQINLVREYLRNPHLIASNRARFWIGLLRAGSLPSWLIYCLAPDFSILAQKPPWRE